MSSGFEHTGNVVRVCRRQGPFLSRYQLCVYPRPHRIECCGSAGASVIIIDAIYQLLLLRVCNSVMWSIAVIVNY